MAKKKGNNYIVDEENQIAKIELYRRNEENLWTIIDLEDLEKVINFSYTWSAKHDPKLNQYYAETTIYEGTKDGKAKYKALKLHKFISNAADNEVVDHVNHDTLDNRKSNLRNIPYGKNSTNRKTKNSNNKSGYRNVSWSKSENVWRVQISINGKNTYLKSFSYEQLEEAGRYAEEMRQKYYGEYAGNA